MHHNQCHPILMEEFGPQHTEHRRIPWPPEWESLSIELPRPMIPLLMHNNPPSPEYAVKVKEFLDDTRRRIQTNDVKIRRSQTKIAELQSTNKKLRKQAYACNVILSPFRRLSYDNLYHIASQFLPPKVPDNVASEPYPPHVLARTSKIWRRTVHDMSNLWTNVYIDCVNWYGRDASPLFNQLQRSSRLAGSRPLVIRLDERCHNVASNPDASALILLIRFLFSPSWAQHNPPFNLVLDSACSHGISKEFQKLARQGFKVPHMNSLFFLPGKHNAEYRSIHEVSTFGALSVLCPALHGLWLGCDSLVLSLGFLFDGATDYRCIWMRNLRCIHLQQKLLFREWLAILQECPNLRSAWLTLSIHADETSEITPLIIHPHLENLVLHFYRCLCHILQPFDNIKFPKIDSLQLHLANAPGIGATWPEARHQETESFADTFPTLRSLSIFATEHLIWATETLRPLFAIVKSIKELSISTNEDLLLWEVFTMFSDSNMDLPSYPYPYIRNVEVEFIVQDSHMQLPQLGTILHEAFFGGEVSPTWCHAKSPKFTLKLLSFPSYSRPGVIREHIESCVEDIERELRRHDSLIDISFEVDVQPYSTAVISEMSRIVQRKYDFMAQMGL
ncbi:hypothetical protein BJ165DRAFT_1476563 [Panaeolus papilionaceus]|nr:hypothetical protein BJ165DRAFT_1476563 [Panaeolus papilionaceus]